VGGNLQPPETPPQTPQEAAGDGRRAQGFANEGRGACWGDVERLVGVSTRQETTGDDCSGQSMGAKWERCGSEPINQSRQVTAYRSVALAFAENSGRAP
jgi:hypothetical protein